MTLPPVDTTAMEAVTPLLEQARQGSATALGTLLQAVRSHLLLHAEQELPLALRAKLGPSDIVQETAIDAHRDFLSFRGTTPEELYAWLRSILHNNVRDAVRRFEISQKRSTHREESIDVVVDRQGVSVFRSAASPPEHSAMRREDAARVLQGLDRVPSDYRTVLRLRYWDGLTFPQIAARIGRTDEAARKLWYRALARLNAEIQAASPGPQDPPHQD
ncbi:MAG: hypothetical protein RLZZ111_1825 [Planctomycetota bacterium]|jgi:RNA polymerase sigma-70 factor (ECF subfamily)